MAKLNYYNLATKKAADERRALIRKLRRQKWSWTEIGGHFNISRQRAQQLGSIKS